MRRKVLIQPRLRSELINMVLNSFIQGLTVAMRNAIWCKVREDEIIHPNLAAEEALQQADPAQQVRVHVNGIHILLEYIICLALLPGDPQLPRPHPQKRANSL